LDIELIISIGIALGFTLLVYHSCRPLGYKVLIVLIVALATTLPFAGTPPPDDDIQVITRHTQVEVNSISCFTLLKEEREYYRPITVRIIHLYHNFWDRNYVGYHIGGAFIFTAIALLVSALVFQIFKRKDIAYLAGVIFALHPAAVASTFFITPKGFGLACALIALIGFIKQMHSGRENHWKTFGQMLLVCAAMFSYEDSAAFLGVFIAAAWLIGNLPLKKAIVKSSPYWVVILVVFVIKFINIAKEAGDETMIGFGFIGRYWDNLSSYFFPFARSLNLPEKFDLLTIADFAASFPYYFSGGLSATGILHWLVRIAAIAVVAVLAYLSRRDSRRLFFLASMAMMTVIPSVFTSSMNYLLISPVVFLMPLIAHMLIEKVNFEKKTSKAILVIGLILWASFSLVQIQKISEFANVEGTKSLYLITKDMANYPDVGQIGPKDIPLIRQQADKIIPTAKVLRYRDLP